MEDGFVDYKEMYLKMVRATEQALTILIQAQQACEELYLQAEHAPPPPLLVFPPAGHAEETV